jgi:inorganic pyrophosphatase
MNERGIGMNLQAVGRHPDFPLTIWAIIEQPREEPNRLRYDPLTATFSRTNRKSIFHERGFSGAYGWIAGTGMPPGLHFDVIVVTRRDPQPGYVLEAYICGMFKRCDNDHKFVALDAALVANAPELELAALPPDDYNELLRLFPDVGPEEGWFGRQYACAFLTHNLPVA